MKGSRVVPEAVARAIGAVAREFASHLDALGCRLTSTTTQAQKVPAWRRVQSFHGNTPSVAPSCFLAPNANVIGRANLADRVGVFYSSVVRADVNAVHIAQNTVVQDRCVIRCTPSYETHIGAHVTIEPGVTISGATVADDCFIGTGSVIMEGARVESQSVIAPGSTLQKHTIVPSGQIWAGCPAEKVRDLTDTEIESLRASAIHGVGLLGAHKDTTEKSFTQLSEEKDVLEEWEDLESVRIPIRAPYAMYDPGPVGSGLHLNIPGQLQTPTGRIR
eukprot:TRINITY_DN870_c0_g1_i1.p1 TRINITY_DN870_c0_g1~~TRINITY_DN870_c0_g1_i1.p1  ORF type:complete len:276 (+),score=72.03 TRINITY_DN870_c0_g1_i1:153-980(+)